MKDVQILVFNDHGIGHMVRVEEFPHPGETIRATEWHFGEDAGKGTNVAVAIGRQGAKAALICKVGVDEEGLLGRRWLEEAGVDATHYVLDPNLSTNRGIVITRADGENMIISNSVHGGRISEEEIRQAIADYPDAPYFVGGFEIGAPEAIYAGKFAKEQGKVVMMNPSPLGPALDLIEDFSYVDYLFVNEKEALELAGIDPFAAAERAVAKQEDGTGETALEELTDELPLDEDLTALAGQLYAKYRPKVIVMTLGGNGCLLYGDLDTRNCADEGDVWAYLPGYPAKAVETAGAGDGFMAAFACAKSWGHDDEEAADWANRYAAVIVSRPGIILTYPTKEEVEESFSI